MLVRNCAFRVIILGENVRNANRETCLEILDPAGSDYASLSSSPSPRSDGRLLRETAVSTEAQTTSVFTRLLTDLKTERNMDIVLSNDGKPVSQ